MTTDNNQPIDDQPVSPHQRVLKVAPQVVLRSPQSAADAHPRG